MSIISMIEPRQMGVVGRCKTINGMWPPTLVQELK